MIYVTKHNQCLFTFAFRAQGPTKCPFRDVTTGGVVRHLVAIKCHSAFFKPKSAMSQSISQRVLMMSAAGIIDLSL